MSGVIPNGPDGINQGPLQEQTAITAGMPGGIPNLANLDQTTAENLLKAIFVQGNAGFGNIVELIFNGLRTGVSLPLAIIESIAKKVLGLPDDFVFFNVDHALSLLKKVPLLSDLLEAITGVEDGDLEDLGTWFLNLRNFFGSLNFLDPDFDVADAANVFIELVLWPANKLAKLVGGFIPILNIPSLDASKIVSGFFSNGLIPGLTTLINDLFGGFTGLGGSGWTNTDAAGAIQSQAQIAAANTAAIAALEARINSAGDTISPIDDFESAPGSDLGPNWRRRIIGLSGGGPPGQWVRDGHNAVWQPGGTLRQIAINQYIGPDGKYSESDVQRIGIVLESSMQGTDFVWEASYNHVLGRMSDDMATFVRAEYRDNQVLIFAVVNDVPTQIGSAEAIQRPVTGTGCYVELGMPEKPDSLYWFRPVINNSPLNPVHDAAHISKVGPGFRGWGFGSYVGIRALTQSLPGAIRAWAAADPQATGSGGGDPGGGGTGTGVGLAVDGVDSRVYSTTTSGGSGLLLTADGTDPRVFVTGSTGLGLATDTDDSRILTTV